MLVFLIETFLGYLFWDITKLLGAMTKNRYKISNINVHIKTKIVTGKNSSNTVRKKGTFHNHRNLITWNKPFYTPYWPDMFHLTSITEPLGLLIRKSTESRTATPLKTRPPSSPKSVSSSVGHLHQLRVYSLKCSEFSEIISAKFATIALTWLASVSTATRSLACLTLEGVKKV